MLPKMNDDEIKELIQNARQSGDLKSLLPGLPIWMVEKASKKRKMTEDDRSDLILGILERMKDMWSLSLKYELSVVLGFFVTYGFNLFRNSNRKNTKLDHSNEYLELWQERRSPNEADTILELVELKTGQAIVDELPYMVGLVLALRYDLPILGNQKKSLEWRLKELDKSYADFARIYDKKKETHLKKIDLYSARVVRYTRLLLDCPENEKRRWYTKKKKEWANLREKALNKCFFSEREVAWILGLSRKEIRSLISKGFRLIYSRRKELLHCA